MVKVVQKIKVQCAECGKIEYVRPCRAKNYLTCSVKCLGAYNKKRYSKKVKKVCPHCQQTFWVKPSQMARRVYCSDRCRKAELPILYRGSGNPNYKGRTENCDGYLTNNARFVVHRETVKGVLKIDELPKTLIVHHKDGNKHSNDPHNLILLTHSLHTWLHKNIGNFLMRAWANGQVSSEQILSLAKNDEERERLDYILKTDCTMQSAVLKQGELLGTPI